MITYQEALDRHNAETVQRSHESETTWKKYSVGTKDFWANIQTGILVGHETITGDYIGIVSDYYSDEDMSGIIWVWMKPDPTAPPLPDFQDDLPVAFGIREDIWLETL